MKTYRLHLKLKGEMTNIPDSPRIFGWIVQQLSDFFGEERAGEFVESVAVGNFMVSNLLPEGYLPIPKSYFIAQLSRKKRAERDKKIYHWLKSMDYVQEKELLQFTKNPDLFFDKIDKWIRMEEDVNLEKEKCDSGNKLDFPVFIQKEKLYAQKFRINSQYYQVPGMKNEAYSIPFIRLKSTNGDYVKDFEIRIQSENPTFLRWLEQGEWVHDIACLGPRSSQGLNIFELVTAEKSEEKSLSENTKFYLNLGMLLPQDILYSKSFFDVHTSSRKPFAFAKYHRNEFQDVISFIDVGSVICSTDPVERVGKCVHNFLNTRYPNAKVFGKSYLMPMEVSVFES